MSRVKVAVNIHLDENAEIAKKYWMSELGLEESFFYKIVPKKISGGKRARHLVNGVASVRINNAYIKRKLNRWMEIAKKEFGSRRHPS